VTSTVARVADGLDEAIGEAHRVLDAVAECLDDAGLEADGPGLKKGLLGMVNATVHASIPIGDATELRDLADEIARVDVPSLRTIVERRSGSTTRDEALRYQAAVPWGEASTLVRFVDAAHAAIQQAHEQMRGEDGVGGGHQDGQRDFRRGAKDCAAALNELAELVPEA
jgi:hypothetical protein